MNLQTVVYDEDQPYAKATIGDLANGNCIISCCQGDAMAERDAMRKLLNAIPFGLHTDTTNPCKCSRCDFVRAAKALLNPQ